MFKFIVIGVVLITAGVFLWPLILTSGRKLSSQFSAMWQDKETQESDTELSSRNVSPKPRIKPHNDSWQDR